MTDVKMILDSEINLGEIILYADAVKKYGENQVVCYVGRVTCRKSCNHDILWTKYHDLKENDEEMALIFAINMMNGLKEQILKGHEV